MHQSAEPSPLHACMTHFELAFLVLCMSAVCICSYRKFNKYECTGVQNPHCYMYMYAWLTVYAYQ